MAKNKVQGTDLSQAMPKQSKSERDYDTEGHIRTLSEAADIMSDPGKLKKVHKLAGRKHKALMGMVTPALKAPIRSIDDLKARANKKPADDGDGDEGGF